METEGNYGELKTRSSVSIFIVVGLCCFFYILGAWQRSGFGKGNKIASAITKQTDCNVLFNLKYETHHGDDAVTVEGSDSAAKEFQPCDDKSTDYTPCEDQMRAMTFPRENMIYRERHCPPEKEKLHCLIPAPKGYAKSRDYVPYANAPYKSLTVKKAVQNWIQYEGNVFRFPDGMYMMEVDRVLGPGGYWLLSGPPINWKNNYQAWYKKLESCATPYPETTEPDEVAGGDWKQFPERLNAAPFRICSGSIPGVSVETYQEDVR
ncbi:hypothetical protein REPUB_Repub08aG0071400 [Reevesia pubescens]